MSESSRVIWHEGMPLKPHHFQQHDRYIHSIVTQRPNSYGMYAWGLTKIVIDESLLQHGKIAVKECSGCFPDGTIFNFPHEDFPPAPLEVDKTCKDTQVFLCIPMTQYGMPNTSISVDKVENTRYRGVSTTVVDQNIDNGTAEEIHVAKLNMKLMLEHEAREYYSCISILKIKEVSPDNAIILDQAFIPPCISVHGIQRLRGIMEEISGLTHNRGEVLSQQLNEIRKCGTSELTDYFILQFINAYDVQLKHFLNKKNLHPEVLFQLLISLMAEFATYTFQSRRPIEIPVYRHENLQATFEPVLTAIRSSLSTILEQNAVALPLEQQDGSTYVAKIEDISLINEAMFVLVAKSSDDTEKFSQLLPNKVKLAPVEQIRNYVIKAIPGIAIRSLSVAPRQLPINTGASYFEIDKVNPLWLNLVNSGGLAIHVSGDFADLKLELWSIKGS